MTHDTLGEPRYTGPGAAALTPEQARIHDAISSGPRGEVIGPLRVWLASPYMAERAQALGQYARYDSVLPPVLSELAVLVTARIWSSGFEWAQHAPLALAAGLSGQTVAAIGQGRCPDLPDARARSVFDFTVELHRDTRVSEPVYRHAEDCLGVQGCVDLVAICGYYTLISMTINAFQIADGDGPQLPAIDTPRADMFRR